MTGPQAAAEPDKTDNESVDSIDFANTGRGTRRKASRKSYVEQRDAADDDEFEQDLIERTRAEEQEVEKAELAKLALKSNRESHSSAYQPRRTVTDTARARLQRTSITNKPNSLRS